MMKVKSMLEIQRVLGSYIDEWVKTEEGRRIMKGPLPMRMSRNAGPNDMG